MSSQEDHKEFMSSLFHHILAISKGECEIEES